MCAIHGFALQFLLKFKVSGGLLWRCYISCRDEAAQAFAGAVRFSFLLCKYEHVFHNLHCNNTPMCSLGSGPCCANAVPTQNSCGADALKVEIVLLSKHMAVFRLIIFTVVQADYIRTISSQPSPLMPL